MMTINNVSMNNSFTNTASKAAFVSNPESKSLQTELMNKQQSLNKLSSDSEMTAQDKEKERRKIQREIAELNRKLKQEHLKEKEEAKEAAKEQEKKKVLQEDLLEKTNSTNKEDSKNESEDASSVQSKDNAVETGIPVVNFQNILAASSITKQNTVQNNEERKIDNQKNILETEIKSDTLYGTDTTAKKEALSELRREKHIQIEEINQQPDQVTPNMNFGSKIIIRE